MTNVITPDDSVSRFNNLISQHVLGMSRARAVPGYTLEVKKATGHGIAELSETLEKDPIGKICPFL